MADGTALTLHVATTGTALAEAFLFADTYHCDAIARTDAQVADVSRTAFFCSTSKDAKHSAELDGSPCEGSANPAGTYRNPALAARFRKAGCLADTLWKTAQRRMGPRGR